MTTQARMRSNLDYVITDVTFYPRDNTRNICKTHCHWKDTLFDFNLIITFPYTALLTTT